MSDVTRILGQIDAGDPAAPAQLLPLVYDELRKLAAAKLAHEQPGHTLQATALVHEAYLRLVEDEPQQWDSRRHFFAAAAEAMRRILVESARRKGALKRGGGRPAFSIDVADAEDRYRRALAHDETPEAAYERQWCLTLLAGVLEDLREEYVATGRQRAFDGLKRFLTGDDDGGGYAAAARELGMTEGAVKVAVHRLRTRYRETLEATVAATVASEDDVADEIEYCLRVLSRS